MNPDSPIWQGLSYDLKCLHLFDIEIKKKQINMISSEGLSDETVENSFLWNKLVELLLDRFTRIFITWSEEY